MKTADKLLVLCGPTATGKTSLALQLSKLFNGEMISADSRQVYKGMDIGTGKDIPKSAKCHMLKGKRVYEINGISVWGYDLADPRDEFSVADYMGFAQEVIKDIQIRKRLPILVGGTGFYIKAVVDGVETAFIPRDERLRQQLNKKNAEQLLEMLIRVDKGKADSLNASDRENPRRLIRALEVARYSKTHTLNIHRCISGKYQTLFIGLTASREEIYKRIEKRVTDRIDAGVKKEIDKLLNDGVRWNNQSMSSLGYREWQDYFNGLNRLEEVKNEWKHNEEQYAKRQMTWFKKDKRIKWFDITCSGWQKKVELSVRKWYHTA